MSFKKSSAFVGFACALVAGAAHAQQYTVVNLGPPVGLPGNGQGIGEGYGINASGQVTGAEYPPEPDTYFGTLHAFVTNATTNAMTDLGTLGGPSSGATSTGVGVNSSGQVTGYSSYGYAEGAYAFLTDATTNTMISLGTLGGSQSWGYSVNDSGQVAGVSYISGGQAEHAFLYSNGVMQDLGTLGGTDSYGYGINASGQVTGGATTAAGALHVFVTDPTTFAMTDLGTLTGYTNSVATGINAGGQVTGYAYSGSTQYRAFVSDAATNAMTDLGTLGGASAEGFGINTSGQVVGTSLIPNGLWHGFVYSNGQILDLNSLLSASDAATYVITSAAGINDNGQIVANAYKTSVVTPGEVVLLLTPAAADAPAKVTR